MKAQSIGKNKDEGFSTLEVLIAFTIVTLSIGAVIFVVFGNQSISIDNQTNNEAISKAQALLEKARADSRFDFNLVNPISTTEASGPLTYTKTLNVETSATDPTLDLWTKRVTSTISWQNAGRNLKTIFTTLLTNPNVEDTCSSVLANADGWKNPQYFTFPSVSFAGPNANGIAISDLNVHNKLLYVTASDTPNPSPNSFFILQLFDDASQNPVILGSLDNNTSSLVGLNSVAVSGNYAYVTNAYTGSASACVVANNCAQLQVINISNPANPAIELSGNLKIPVTTSGSKLASGKSIFYSKGYVYIGLTAASGNGDEFNIVDVGGGGGSASPTNPILRGSYNIGHDVNSIYVKNNYAYIASPNTKNLIVLDVSDPDSPTLADSYTPTNGLNHGSEVYVVGNTAYLGRNFGADEFQILNVSNNNNISLIAKKDIGTTNQTSIHGLLVRDYLVFIVTLSQFQVWDISNPSSMKPWTSDGTVNTFLSTSLLGGSGTATNCEGDRIYIAVASSQGNNKDILAVITPGIPSVYSLSNSGNITVDQGSSGSNNITRTLVSGASSSFSLSVSGLPTGATFTENPCTPTCTSQFSISTISSTPTGTYPITVTGPGTATTTFNLIVNPAIIPFTYTITNPSVLPALTKNGPAVNFIATVTMAAGATPQLITLTPPKPKNNINANAMTCTPLAVSPYTCSVTFSYSASNGSSGTYINQQISGAPNATTGTSFTITVN